MDQWKAWPTFEETAPLWQAAAAESGRENVPESFFNDDPLLDIDTDPESLRAVRDFAEYNRGYLRSRVGDRLTLHRYVAPPLSEEIEAGGDEDFRTLSSWSTSADAIGTFAQEIHGSTEGLVLTADMPVEWVWAAWPIVPPFGEGQNEVVVAIPPGPSYQSARPIDFRSFIMARGIGVDRWSPKWG